MNNSRTASSRVIRAVVFDIDDTLYPESSFVLSGYRAMGQELRRQLGRTDDFEGWLWKRFLDGASSGALEALSENFKLGLGRPQIEELVSLYRNHRPDIRPYDGVVEMLTRLRETCRLGALSDGYMPTQELKLKALGLERFFDAVVYTELLGREFWKPSPRGFEIISQKLQVPPEACAYVADNAGKDFAAPNKLGWLTIKFLRPGQLKADLPPCQDGLPQMTLYSAGQLLRAVRDSNSFEAIRIAM